jgi:Predicted transcriptional regulators
MNFSSERPIFLQIAESICERILSGSLKPGERIPSVREEGAELGVNPNTVMRTYEKLTDDGVIFNRRGIGYFVSEDALEKVLEAERKQFMEEELPAFVRRVKLLGISEKEILSAIKASV